MVAIENPTHYPTPTHVIRQMIEPYRRSLWGAHILEPSAGDGRILDYLKETCRQSITQLYAVEIDADLRFTLQGKGYRVIANDFLEYSGDYLFDLIIMNPPFDKGDEHLLKAWDIMRQGDIVCLLNAETIRNAYSERRKLLTRIIQDHGSVEYLGEVFKTADRKTAVDIALVRLRKNQPDQRFEFNFGEKETGFDFTEETVSNEVAMNDKLGAMLRQYDKAKSAYINYLRAKEELEFFSAGLLTDTKTVTNLIESVKDKDPKVSYNNFVTALNGESWSTILSKLNIDKYFTNKVREDFGEFRKKQGTMQLTREAVYELIGMLIDNRVDIMERAVVEVFDLFTAYHHDNRMHVEGWKTNVAWKVNRKIILPNWVKYGEYLTAAQLKDWGAKFSIDYRCESRYSDVDKVMSYISGKDYNQIRTLNRSLRDIFEQNGTISPGMSFIDRGESEFFRFRFFKKGTLHIEFKDEKLWQEFNLRACRGKAWLPK